MAGEANQKSTPGVQRTSRMQPWPLVWLTRFCTLKQVVGVPFKSQSSTENEQRVWFAGWYTNNVWLVSRQVPYNPFVDFFFFLIRSFKQNKNESFNEIWMMHTSHINPHMPPIFNFRPAVCVGLINTRATAVNHRLEPGMLLLSDRHFKVNGRSLYWGTCVHY